MHPVLGTMMPEICGAPHLPVFSLHSSQCSSLNGGMCSLHFFITGAYERYGESSYFTEFKGVPASYVEAALDRGYTLIGTDAFSLDPPFAVMSRKFVATRDQSVLWPAHVLGRRRPYFQIERLANLKDFETAKLVEFIALPIKLHCGAAWTRAVARIIE